MICGMKSIDARYPFHSCHSYFGDGLPLTKNCSSHYLNWNKFLNWPLKLQLCTSRSYHFLHVTRRWCDGCPEDVVEVDDLTSFPRGDLALT